MYSYIQHKLWARMILQMCLNETILRNHYNIVSKHYFITTLVSYHTSRLTTNRWAMYVDNGCIACKVPLYDEMLDFGSSSCCCNISLPCLTDDITAWSLFYSWLRFYCYSCVILKLHCKLVKYPTFKHVFF